MLKLIILLFFIFVFSGEVSLPGISQQRRKITRDDTHKIYFCLTDFNIISMY